MWSFLSSSESYCEDSICMNCPDLVSSPTFIMGAHLVAWLPISDDCILDNHWWNCYPESDWAAWCRFSTGLKWKKYIYASRKEIVINICNLHICSRLLNMFTCCLYMPLCCCSCIFQLKESRNYRNVWYKSAGVMIVCIPPDFKRGAIDEMQWRNQALVID